MNSPIVEFDPTRRQILPRSAAVSLKPFTTKDHSRSAQLREALDLDVPEAPATSESIEMSGNVIRSEFRTGSHVARRKLVCSFTDDTPLSIAPEAFAAADPSLQDAASEALARLAERKPSGRRSHRLVRKQAPAPRATRLEWVAAAIVLGSLMIAALVFVATR